MEQIVSENIFLLEFVVDKCIILPCALPNEIQEVLGETCVSFKFFDYEPLNVCEEDFSPKRMYGAENENMKSGKSCLFAMSSMQATTALTEFDILVGVFKKVIISDELDEVPDSKIMIGMATIPIDETFTEVIDVVKMNKEDSIKETVARSMKDVFSIVNTKNEIIGSIDIFLRLSCFGKIIVTQFQMNLEEKSVFFSDKDGKSLFKYRKFKKEEIKPAIETENEVDNEALNCVPRQPTCTPVTSAVQVDQIPEFDGRCIGCNPVLIHDEAPSYPCPDDKDVFILRIGKKGDTEGKRPKMELVLVTPKGIGKKYTTKLDDETEFNENDCPGGKLGKTKKDKSKKKDKGDKKKNENNEEVKEIKEPKPEEKKPKEVTKEVKEVKKSGDEKNIKIEKEVKIEESNKNKDKDKQKDQKKELKFEKYTIKFESDTNKDKKDMKTEKEVKNVEIVKNKNKQKDKKKDVKVDKEIKKADNSDKIKEKENKNTIPSYANVMLMKADREMKNDNQCCLPSWCQSYMPTLPQSIPCTSITCVAYDNNNNPCDPQQEPPNCYMSWDTPSSITLKCSKGKIRGAICC